MKRLACAIGLALLPLPSTRADEGMWMPEQIPALAGRLKALGFRGDANAFADLTGFPMGAVVSLGGCSASFVSPDGLIVTNHHCVQGALQFNSKPERNLMKDGFLARTREEELWAGPGSRVYVTVAFRDVTRDILGGIDPGLSDRERFDLIERRVKAQTAACEKEGLRCTIAPFFDGLKWYQISQLEIRDVRLVYAPSAGIGNFGGETDNWQWPRHTGDFSFYRAYVAKDGRPAPHSKDNVPYKPKHHLKVSPGGASPGEVVFVAGYPGRTYRLNTFGQVKETVDWRLPRAIRRSTDRIAILEKLAEGNPETAIRVSTTIRGLNNGLTKNKGVLQGLVQGGLLAQKEVTEKELLAWIDGTSERRAQYGDVLPALNALRAEAAKTRERDALLTELTFGAGSALGAAETLHRFAAEKPKPDADRDPAFQERNWRRIREGLDRMQRSLDPTADRALMRYTLADVARLAGDQRIEALDRAIGLKPGMAAPEALESIDRFLDKLIAGTQVYKKDARLSYLGKSGAELAGANDAMLALAAALHPLQEAIRNKAKERSGANYRLGPRYAAALLAKNGGLMAPDANSTLRVTYGTVKGVEARDGLFYLPQTTLAGVLQKATGKGEFNAPRAELEAIEALRGGKSTPYLDPKLRDVPVDFLSTVDTTGGNSGSATLNGRGELVGLLFDGTFDTVASDYLFDREKTRSIHVDTRGMLWVMTEVDKAYNLLQELGLPGHSSPDPAGARGLERPVQK